MLQYSLCHDMDIGTCGIVHWSAAPHDCIANRTGFWVNVVLVLNAIRYSCHYSLYIIIYFIMIVVTITGIFMALNYLLIYTFVFLYISKSGSANAQLPGCFCPWTFSLNIGLRMFPLDSLYVMFTSPTRIFYRRVPGFATDCPCGVWCRGLTTCPLYFGPLFGNLV